MKYFPEWAAMLLKLTGITSALWGLTFTLFPDILFRWANMQASLYFFPWRMLGAVAITFGVFYFLAAFNPVRHAMVVAMGITLKLTEFILLVAYAVLENFSNKMMLLFVLKDFVWVFPLGIILFHIIRFNRPPTVSVPDLSFSETLAIGITTQGHSLSELAEEQPVLLVFLRHFNDAACHETLKELHDKRPLIESRGTKIVLVHMAAAEDALFYLKTYRLEDIAHISDRTCMIYGLFRLEKIGLQQRMRMLFKEALPYPAASLPRLHSGHSVGDRYRMPGAFLVFRGELLKSYKHAHPADMPDYVALSAHA